MGLTISYRMISWLPPPTSLPSATIFATCLISLLSLMLSSISSDVTDPSYSTMPSSSSTFYETCGTIEARITHPWEHDLSPDFTLTSSPTPSPNTSCSLQYQVENTPCWCVKGMSSCSSSSDINSSWTSIQPAQSPILTTFCNRHVSPPFPSPNPSSLGLVSTKPIVLRSESYRGGEGVFFNFEPLPPYQYQHH